VSTSLVDECYRRAQEARRSAEVASMPSQRTHFLDLEQRWLRAAESVTSKTVQETKAPIAQVAAPDVDQPSHGAQENDVAAHRSDEIGNKWARGNLALTIQYRGLEHAIPLRLSNDAIAMLTLEAEVRKVSLGQLVGMLIEAALDLPQVLDKTLADKPE
jgi:hypothetical protein